MTSADGATSAETVRRHWNTVAHQWRYFGPPLRPCAEDLGAFRELAGTFGPRASPLPWQILLLGVTPEVATMDWPKPYFLTAVDRSPAMVQVVWPGDVAGQRRALAAEWTAPLAFERKIDVVVGDGSFISMTYPDGYRRLFRHLRAVLAPQGLLLGRFFVRPDSFESPPQVLRDLRDDRIGSFHAFKWRLAMAVQENAAAGARLHDIWKAWSEARIEAGSLGRGSGWSAAEVATIDLYRGKENRFAFASREELNRVLDEDFVTLAERTPGYELGDRCPILALRPR